MSINLKSMWMCAAAIVMLAGGAAGLSVNPNTNLVSQTMLGGVMWKGGDGASGNPVQITEMVNDGVSYRQTVPAGTTQGLDPATQQARPGQTVTITERDASTGEFLGDHTYTVVRC